MLPLIHRNISRREMAAAGTFETCRQVLRMFVDGGGAEVVGPGSEPRRTGAPMPITPAAFDAQIKREIDAILTLAKAANLKFN